MEMDKALKDMEAYRQGYEQGRANVIIGFQKLLEKICLDIDELKKHIIPEKKDYSKESEEAQALVTDPTADGSRTFCFRKCGKRVEKPNKPKECMIGKCKDRVKKPASQPTS